MLAHDRLGKNPGANPVILILIILAGVIVIFLQVEWMGRNRSRFVDVELRQFQSLIQAQTVRIQCQYCEGSGVVRSEDNPEDMLVCSLCFGMGMNQVRQIYDHDVLCHKCGGLGRVHGEGRNGLDCNICEGRGLVEHNLKKFSIQATQIVCANCEGRGVLRNEEDRSKLDTCEVCFGLGSQLVRQMDAHDTLCESCGGMGRIIDGETNAGRPCTRCGGRGLTLSHLP